MTFPHPIPYSVLKTHGIANTENSIVLKTICSVTSSLTEWICLSFCRLRLIYDWFSVNPNLQFKVDKRCRVTIDVTPTTIQKRLSIIEF